MLYDMHLYGENFDKVEVNDIFREYRLYDEKRELLNIGDTIRFLKLPDNDQCYYANIIKIEIFNTWYDCYKKYFEEDFKDRYDSIDAVVDDTYNGGYYTREETEKYGCCCITLSKVRKN